MPQLKKSRISQGHSDKLSGEHRYSDVGQAILACLFFAVWITDSFFEYSAFLNQYITNSVRMPLGIVLLVISAYLASTGLYIMFVKKREEPTVIREGAFRIIRHPIYLSEIMLYLGLLMLSISLAALVVWIISIGFLHYISRYEEKLLIACFGEDYRQYIKEVPMWIPLPRRK